MFPLLVAVLTLLILLHFLPTNQDILNWIKPVGIRVIVAEFDADYVIGLLFP